jgi:hypothetical protein
MRNTPTTRLIHQQAQNGVAITLGQAHCGNQTLSPSFSTSTSGLPLSGGYTLIQEPLIQTLSASDPRLNASYQQLTSNPRYLAANNSNNGANNTYTLLPLANNCNNGASYYVTTSSEPIGTTNNTQGQALQ